MSLNFSKTDLPKQVFPDVVVKRYIMNISSICIRIHITKTKWHAFGPTSHLAPWSHFHLYVWMKFCLLRAWVLWAQHFHKKQWWHPWSFSELLGQAFSRHLKIGLRCNPISELNVPFDYWHQSKSPNKVDKWKWASVLSILANFYLPAILHSFQKDHSDRAESLNFDPCWFWYNISWIDKKVNHTSHQPAKMKDTPYGRSPPNCV